MAYKAEGQGPFKEGDKGHDYIKWLIKPKAKVPSKKATKVKAPSIRGIKAIPTLKKHRHQNSKLLRR
jgi:hypothetical protein